MAVIMTNKKGVPREGLARDFTRSDDFKGAWARLSGFRGDEVAECEPSDELPPFIDPELAPPNSGLLPGPRQELLPPEAPSPVDAAAGVLSDALAQPAPIHIPPGLRILVGGGVALSSSLHPMLRILGGLWALGPAWNMLNKRGE